MKRLKLLGLSLLVFVYGSFDLAKAVSPKINFDNLTGTEWYGIYMGRNKIGFSKSEFQSTGKNRWTTTTTMTMSFNVDQAGISISETEKRTYEGENAELISLSHKSKNPAGDIIIEGKAKADSFQITSTIAGQKSIRGFGRPAEILEDVIKTQLLAIDKKLKINDTLFLSSFVADPPIASIVQHTIIVRDFQQMIFGGIPISVFKVLDSIPAMNLSAEIFITESGQILEQRIAGMALITRAEPEEIARRVDESFDLLENNLIRTDSGPGDSRAIDKATYLITGYDLSDLPQSNLTTIQSFKSDSALLTIIRDSLTADGTTIPVNQAEVTEFLNPEQLIQSGNREIINQAKKIIGQENNALKAAGLINDWVYRNVKKEYSPELSNALTTLHTKKGDCGEHAALATALLRAAGIPARLASGIVYWPQGKGFAYHAWVEAYVGRWIQMDPSWGETSANATHIMLTNGGIEKQIGVMVNALKGIKISFISYE